MLQQTTTPPKADLIQVIREMQLYIYGEAWSIQDLEDYSYEELLNLKESLTQNFEFACHEQK